MYATLLYMYTESTRFFFGFKSKMQDTYGKDKNVYV